MGGGGGCKLRLQKTRLKKCNYMHLDPPPCQNGACDTNLSMDCHNKRKLNARKMQKNDEKKDGLDEIQNNAKNAFAFPLGRGMYRQILEERGGGSGTQKFVYLKWPDKTFPVVNFVSPHFGHFGLGGSSHSYGPF